MPAQSNIKMKKFIITIIASISIGSASFANPADSTFDIQKNQFIETLWSHYPEWATAVGVHTYDNQLTIFDENGLKNRKQLASNALSLINKIDPKSLNELNQIDYHLIKNFLERTIWEIDVEKSWQWNPAQYNVGDAFALLLYEKYAPLEKRLESFATRAALVPAYFQAAQKNISNPAEVLRQLAVDQNEGTLPMFEDDFVDSVNASKLTSSKKKEMLQVANDASEAIRSYIVWLENLRSASPRSFRLGADLYEQKFKFDIQSAYAAKELYDLAIQRKKYVHEEMAKLSKQLWPKYFGSKAQPSNDLELIHLMIDTLSVKHVKASEFQNAIEKQIPELVKFVEEKNLLYIDPSKPLVVRKEPAYMAGVAGASISAPGPYDKGGNTYYNVGSLEGWPADKAESYLREYNHYILQILNIHEAIPGHYTQLVYSNNAPSLIKSILGNGSMVEGWAVYTEQMMLENGYGNNEPEMWLMWYKWNLRTVCNTILDYSVHVLNMEREEALSLLTDQAFQQKAEAEGKWKRVSVSSVQLTSYFNGYSEIIALRNKIIEKQQKNFNLKAFNEKFLSYGSAPVKYIAELMTE